MNLRQKLKINKTKLSIDDKLMELNDYYIGMNNTDVVVSQTFYIEEPDRLYICGLLCATYNNGDIELDYSVYSYGSTINTAINNFYNKFINEVKNNES